ncbi:MAG: hypothetical protein WCP46_09730 [Alphaproteobacteria bacterium]
MAMSMEERLKRIENSEEVVNDGYYAGEYEDGIFCLLVEFLGDYSVDNTLDQLKKLFLKSNDDRDIKNYENILRQDFEYLISHKDKEQYLKILSFLKKYIIRNQREFPIFTTSEFFKSNFIFTDSNTDEIVEDFYKSLSHIYTTLFR